MIRTSDEARELARYQREPYALECEVCGAEIVAHYANREAVCDRCYHREYHRAWWARRRENDGRLAGGGR